MKFLIPDVPISLNRLFSMHWASRHRIKKQWYLLVSLCKRDQRIPIAKGKRRITSIKIYFRRKAGRPPDPDNFLKFLLDGLVKTKIIIDDSQKWVSYPTPKIFKGSNPRTEIEIEDEFN